MADIAHAKGERDGKEEVQNDELVELAMKLINVQSLSGEEQPMAVVLKRWLEERGWIVELQEVAPQKSTPGGIPRHNVYARRPCAQTDRAGGPRVLFNSHIDTVGDESMRRMFHVSYCPLPSMKCSCFISRL